MASTAPPMPASSLVQWRCVCLYLSNVDLIWSPIVNKEEVPLCVCSKKKKGDNLVVSVNGWQL